MAGRRPPLDTEQIGLLRNARDENVFTAEFVGKRVSLTGTHSMQRSDLKTLLRLIGATYDERPVRGTHFLIVGDTGAHGMTKKIQDALALGIEVLEEHEFARRLSPPAAAVLTGS